MTIVVDSADRYVWGGESLVLDGVPVGEIASAGWSAEAGRCIGLGYLRGCRRGGGTRRNTDQRRPLGRAGRGDGVGSLDGH